MHKHPVFLISLAQLFGTSLWFSANSAADDLMRSWGVTAADIGWLTNAVQGGFILGTLVFAVSGLADRFPASRIFALCAVLGAFANAGFAWLADGLASGIGFRFLVGLALAGVYPLGMKLIVGWVPERAGSALAQLVGMLTLGTALPHAVRLFGAAWQWQAAILTSSVLALAAAVLILALGDGPHLVVRKGAGSFSVGKVFAAFSLPDFRASAFGYFGHMWEL
ncbi:MAG: MFS transporter, partial [Zoogloea sp.]|nr:MFS transporter [Zoogloea sp.]